MYGRSHLRLTEPLWTDPGLKSGISMRKLIYTLKWKAQAGNEWLNIFQNPNSEDKAVENLLNVCAVINCPSHFTMTQIKTNIIKSSVKIDNDSEGNKIKIKKMKQS